MSTRSLSAAAFLAAAALVPAGHAQTASTNPATVQSGHYVVEPYHTRVLFAVSHFGFTTYYGDFTQVSGTLDLAAGKRADSRVSISLPIATVSTTNPKLDEELKGPQWFNAAVFPTASFQSTRITPTGPSSAKVEGNFTLHGVTHPLILDVTFHGAGINVVDHNYTVGFDATGTLKRSDYGVTTYVPLVGDEVQLIISAAFEKRG